MDRPRYFIIGVPLLLSRSPRLRSRFHRTRRNTRRYQTVGAAVIYRNPTSFRYNVKSRGNSKFSSHKSTGRSFPDITLVHARIRDRLPVGRFNDPDARTQFRNSNTHFTIGEFRFAGEISCELESSVFLLIFLT